MTHSKWIFIKWGLQGNRSRKRGLGSSVGYGEDDKNSTRSGDFHTVQLLVRSPPWPALTELRLAELMYLAFTRMPGESYRWRLWSLLLCLCDVFRALITSLVCWFCTELIKNDPFQEHAWRPGRKNDCFLGCGWNFVVVVVVVVVVFKFKTIVCGSCTSLVMLEPRSHHLFHSTVRSQVCDVVHCLFLIKLISAITVISSTKHTFIATACVYRLLKLSNFSPPPHPHPSSPNFPSTLYPSFPPHGQWVRSRRGDSSHSTGRLHVNSRLQRGLGGRSSIFTLERNFPHREKREKKRR